MAEQSYGSSPIWVETCAPMKRGLKDIAKSWGIGPHLRVETCAPMKRGLKEFRHVPQRSVDSVETCAPMKRGLKDNRNPGL